MPETWKPWTREDEEHLDRVWGLKSSRKIAQELGRSLHAVETKAYRLGLGKTWERYEHLTLSHIVTALYGYSNASVYRKAKRIGIPINEKKLGKRKVCFVNMKLFWKWLKDRKDEYDFTKIEKFALGDEPDWVDKKRKADWEAYNKKRWSQYA